MSETGTRESPPKETLEREEEEEEETHTHTHTHTHIHTHTHTPEKYVKRLIKWYKTCSLPPGE